MIGREQTAGPDRPVAVPFERVVDDSDHFAQEEGDEAAGEEGGEGEGNVDCAVGDAVEGGV